MGQHELCLLPGCYSDYHHYIAADHDYSASDNHHHVPCHHNH